jgi:molecular chaperone GrpE
MTDQKLEPSSSESNGGADIPPIFVTIPEVELEQIKREAEEYRDKYLRQLADADNLRKRLQKERQELTQYAIRNLIAEMLNPIDHLDNALKFTEQSSNEVKHWAIGFQMILSQFKDVLANNGVVPFQSVGMPFDPHIHEAVEMVSSKEHPPGVVLTESIKGYKMGDKIIRPARVTVSKAPEEQPKEKQEVKEKE